MSKGIIDFKDFNEDESTEYLAAHWPIGKLTGKKYVKDSWTYKLIKSIAVWIQDFSGNLYSLVINRDIDQADELMLNWEESVKIPENIPRRDTIEGRREAVKCLTSKIPVYNIANGIVDKKTTFEYYIKCLTGIEVTIRTSKVDGDGSSFPLKFPSTFGITGASGNLHFIISVIAEGTSKNNSFPLEFPVVFFDPQVPDATKELLDKVLERVIPSFCRWTYETTTA